MKKIHMYVTCLFLLEADEQEKKELMCPDVVHIDYTIGKPEVFEEQRVECNKMCDLM